MLASNDSLATSSRTYLQVAVAGQLLIDGHSTAVALAENAEAANPVQADGRIVFDEKVIETCENAIVRKML